MRKQFALALALLCLLAVGCGPQKEPESPQPLHLETLAVEFAPGDGDGSALLGATRRFPEVFRAALEEVGVAVDEVRVSIGTPDATARAVGQGGVDVAVLTAEGYVSANSGGAVCLADPGRTALLCAGTSDYGRALSGRKSPTWDELNHARWGVLAAESDLGHRYLNLWLADGYEGRTLADLTHVTVYDGYEALLRAAVAEEIDAFPATAEFLQEISDAWTLEPTRNGNAGYRGFGREAALAEEVTVFGETAPRYSRLAVVREDETMQGEVFQAALRQALNALAGTDDRDTLAGVSLFAPVTDDALNPLRRLLTIEVERHIA